MRPRIRTRRGLVCQQAVDLVTGYLEGALGRAARARLEAHLAACPNCTAYLEQIRVTIRLTGTITPGDLPAQARDDLIRVYRQWHAQERQAPQRHGDQQHGDQQHGEWQ
jgi:anti-sigma factor RsiW